MEELTQPPAWFSASRVVALAGLGMVLVSLPFDWGKTCFIGCSELQPLQRPFAPWLLVGVAGTAVALVARGPRWALTVLAVVSLGCLTFWLGISWIFLKDPTFPALVGTLGLLLGWSAPFARLGAAKTGPMGRV